MQQSSSVGTSIAMQQIDVESFGHRFVVLIAISELIRQLLKIIAPMLERLHGKSSHCRAKKQPLKFIVGKE